MKAIIKNPKRFFELLRLYFVPVRGRKVVHVTAYAYKEDENKRFISIIMTSTYLEKCLNF